MSEKIKAVPCDVYSRQCVVGYYTPIQHWNKGKLEEYRDRHQMSKCDLIAEERGRG